MRHVDNATLLDRIAEAATVLGRPPRAQEVRGYVTISRRFGSWNAALRAAGLPVAKFIDKAHLLDALRAKADELGGRPPLFREIKADPTMPSATTYARAFGSYRDACREAGLNLAAMPAANRTYANGRDYHLRRTYGITADEYDEMHDLQRGRCAICQESETRTSNRSGNVLRLAVDHCHTGGHVRALLCHRCNNTLGTVADNPALLRKMADYVDAHAPTRLVPR